MAHRLIVFDGVCHLCAFWVQFIIRRDPEKRFRFATLQSPIGQQMLHEAGVQGRELTTMIFVDGEGVHVKSSAALHIARQMKGGWPLLYGFIVIPASIRDVFYSIIARNRYRWFGKQQACLVPSPELKERFLE